MLLWTFIFVHVFTALIFYCRWKVIKTGACEVRWRHIQLYKACKAYLKKSGSGSRFVVFCCVKQWSLLPISLRIVSLVLVQSFEFSASETSLKNHHEMIICTKKNDETTPIQKTPNCEHNLWGIQYMQRKVIYIHATNVYISWDCLSQNKWYCGVATNFICRPSLHWFKPSNLTEKANEIVVTKPFPNGQDTIINCTNWTLKYTWFRKCLILIEVRHR